MNRHKVNLNFKLVVKPHLLLDKWIVLVNAQPSVWFIFKVRDLFLNQITGGIICTLQLPNFNEVNSTVAENES